MAARDRESTLRTALLLLGITALSVWLVGQIAEFVARVADVALIFIFAWALAYLLSPPIAWIESRTRLGRAGAVGVVYAALLALLVAALALAVPVLVTQLSGFLERLPEFGDALNARVQAIQADFTSRGIQVDVAGLYGTIPARLAEVSAEFAADAFAVVGGIFSILFDVSLVLIVAFFMLVDGDHLWHGFVAVLPVELASEAELLRRSADLSFGGFLRGQLVLGAAYGVLTWIVFAVIGVPFAALLAVVSGLLMVIPFFGAIAAMLPPLVVTVPQGPQTVLVTFVALLVLQNIMLNVVGPRLIGHAVGIHPLFVFLALLLGARVAGLWGVFLAIPIAGIVNVFARYAMEVASGQRARRDAAELVS